MSKVVLIAINSKHVHSSLAVWLLAAGVREYARLSHETKIAEATIHQSGHEIAKRIARLAPDVIGISVYIWNAHKIPELLILLREQIPKAAVVLGGPEAAHNAEYWLQAGADYVLRGEGEHSFPLLLDALDGQENANLDMVPGLLRKVDGKTVQNDEEKSCTQFLNPYDNAYFDALNGRIAYIETSRGCPFQCAFCLSGNSSLRFSSIDEAKKRIYTLSQSGTRTIKLVDRTFNCDMDRAYELFKYVIELDTQCCFHFEAAADLFDDRTLELLGTASPGRIQLEIGLQSFYRPALNAVTRRTDLDKAEQNIRTLLKAGNIHIHLDLIAGLPTETLKDFKESFDRAYQVKAHTLQLGFLKLLHGSSLRERAANMGIVYSHEPPYEIISSPWLGQNDLALLKQVEDALRRTYNKGRFLSSLKYTLEATGLRPFELYLEIGATASGYSEQLAVYSHKLYDCLVNLPGVNADILRDHMVCDWLSINRGKNLPPFLRIPDKRRRHAAEIAESILGYRLERNESMVLHSYAGRAVFVDGRAPDPVTGLYKLRFVDL